MEGAGQALYLVARRHEQMAEVGLKPETLDVVGRMELLATEVMEGLRPEAEFWQEATEFVARETNSLYVRQVFPVVKVADSSNDSTTRPPEIIATGVVVSQSWSISPQLVPG